MSGPTIRAREILAPRERPAHSTAANIGTTSAAVAIGGFVGSQSGEAMAGMATTVFLKWLGGVARDKKAQNPEGWKKHLWTVLSFLG